MRVVVSKPRLVVFSVLLVSLVGLIYWTRWYHARMSLPSVGATVPAAFVQRGCVTVGLFAGPRGGAFKWGSNKPVGLDWWFHGASHADQTRYVRIPLWPAVILILAATPLFCLHRVSADTCVICGYNLSGIESGICPECGHEQRDEFHQTPQQTIGGGA